LFFQILISIFVKQMRWTYWDCTSTHFIQTKKTKLKITSMKQLKHTMSFTICSIWADERAMHNSLGDWNTI